MPTLEMKSDDVRNSSKVQPDVISARQKYSFAIDQLESPSQVDLDLWSAMFAWIPIFGKLFKWRRLNVGRERRDSIPADFPILKPGVLTSDVISNTLSFKWLRSLTADRKQLHDLNLRSSYITEHQTVCIAASILLIVSIMANLIMIMV